MSASEIVTDSATHQMNNNTPKENIPRTNEEKETSTTKQPVKPGILKSWCQRTTCHGLLDFLEAEKLERLAWALVILLSFAFFFQDIVFNIYTYFGRNQWVSRTFNDFEEYLIFPSVLICNFNRLNFTKSEQEWNLTETHLDYINRYFEYTWRDFDDLYGSFLDEAKVEYLQWKKMHFPNQMSFQDLVFDLGHDCEETLRIVLYGTEFISNPCRLVRNFGMPSFGKCLLFTLPEESRKVYNTGTRHSLRLMLDTNLNDYQANIQNNFWDLGIALFLFHELENNDGGLPKLVFDNKWISVAPGFHTWIGIDFLRQVVAVDDDKSVIGSRINPAPCVSNGEIKVLNAFAYTVIVCELDCSYSAVLERCGCVPFYNTSSYDMCEPEFLDACLEKWSNKFNKNNSNSGQMGNADMFNISYIVSKQCRDKCRSSCNSYSFKTEVSLSKFPSPKQLNKINELFMRKKGINLTTEYIKENFAAVDIFYDSKMVATSEWHLKMTFSQLLSSIGGELGLCAGISVITFIQALWFLGYCVKDVTKQRKNRKAFYLSKS